MLPPHVSAVGRSLMDSPRKVLAIYVLLLIVSVSARLQPRDGSLEGNPGRGVANSIDQPPSTGPRTLMFDFSQGGGALQMLGHEQLGRISSRTGLKGDITTLAAHLDEDDDLVGAT